MFTATLLRNARAQLSGPSPAWKLGLNRQTVKFASSLMLRSTADASIIYGGVTAYKYHVMQDPDTIDTVHGLQRQYKFYSTALPILAHYKGVEWQLDWNNATQDERDVRFDELHDMYAPAAVDLVLGLRGLYVKIGQVAASRQDMLPEQYRKALSVCLDSVPPIETDQALAVTEKALGRPIHQVFSEFDPVPIGVASISQVHRARLKGSNEDVVVKIQLPGIEKMFQLDFLTMRQFVALAQPEQMPFMKELEKQFLSEFDFSRETWALQTVREQMQESGLLADGRIRIPRVFPELCNRDVVVMEYLPGVQLSQAMMSHYEKLAKAMGVDVKVLMQKPPVARSDSKPDSSKNPFAPPSSSSSSSSAGAVVPYSPPVGHIARFKAAIAIATFALQEWVYFFKRTFVHAWNSSIGTSRPSMQIAVHDDLIDLDGNELEQLLFRVHGEQLLIHGLFNGDPHPGNILLSHSQRDGSPVLGLIDYGQVKQLTDEQRRSIARMVVAVAEKDRAQIVREVKAMGVTSKNNLDDTFLLLGTFMFGTDENHLGTSLTCLPQTQPLQIQEYFTVTDPLIDMPGWFTFPMRMTLILRGLGMFLTPGHSPNPSQLWRPIAERALAATPST
ncbi:ABC1 family-domain-containing protein [Catenaria anguillulae PL171]|uniref:ABC1 family-domain-containing protein n=1 Tax=Catenaria anguillulae PL171 TaxID=765915 RepID=A0A1Y2H4Q2_9FUNG|nr:ABC1 family-domain-containing protein [Catenaria anguillulae PL171]